jgi:hypothetical protein
MLSYAMTQTERGWGFGLHEAIDQIGTTIGPVFVAMVVLQDDSYRRGFAMLLVPALAALGSLALAWRLYPNPRALEPATASVSTKGSRAPTGCTCWGVVW